MAEAGTGTGGATGTGAAGQAGNGGAGQTTSTGAGATSTDWTTGLSQETRGYVQKKGFKDAGALADSYINLEKLHSAGPDKLLKLPESWEGPEAQAVWERLGKPKDAKSYNLKVPEKGGDQKFADWAGEAFLKNNLTATQAQGVINAWNDRQAAAQLQTVENQKIAVAQAVDSLKTEWGAAYEKKMNLAKSGAIALKLDAATIDAIANVQGAAQLYKTLSEIGAGVGESTFVAGRPAPDGVITPDQARAELEELKRDQGFVQKYLKGDFDAKKKMEHLQKMANPGEQRLT